MDESQGPEEVLLLSKQGCAGTVNTAGSGLSLSLDKMAS